MHNRTLQSLGLSAIFIGLAIGSLSRTLHVADSTKSALSILSILCSLLAVGLFVKAAPPNRRPVIIGAMVVGTGLLVAITYLILHR